MNRDIETNPPTDTTRRRIILPYNNTAVKAQQVLRYSNIDVITRTSRTVKNLIKPSSTSPNETTAGIYSIPCQTCPKSYIGETSRNIETRIREHKYSLRTNDQQNACVSHRDEQNHEMNFDESRLIIQENDKRTRKLLESAKITTSDTINNRQGFFKLSTHLARKILIDRKPHQQ